MKNWKKNMVYICTPDKQIVYVWLDLKRGKIESRTIGGIAKLREFGWDIEKKKKRKIPLTDNQIKEIYE